MALQTISTMIASTTTLEYVRRASHLEWPAAGSLVEAQAGVFGGIDYLADRRILAACDKAQSFLKAVSGVPTGRSAKVPKPQSGLR